VISIYRGWLLDTNVVSELRRPRPDKRVLAFVAGQPAALLYLSTVTLAEIRYGIERLADPERRRDIAAWLDRTLRPLFAGRTLGLDEDVILRWRQLLESGRNRGHTFSQPDLFIASIGALERLVVVSRNTREFVAAGVAALDPWTGEFVAGGDRRSVLTQLADAGLLATLSFRP
jgi:predicted nucleic acid-binding protein